MTSGPGRLLLRPRGLDRGVALLCGAWCRRGRTAMRPAPACSPLRRRRHPIGRMRRGWPQMSVRLLSSGIDRSGKEQDCLIRRLGRRTGTRFRSQRRRPRVLPVEPFDDGAPGQPSTFGSSRGRTRSRTAMSARRPSARSRPTGSVCMTCAATSGSGRRTPLRIRVRAANVAVPTTRSTIRARSSAARSRADRTCAHRATACGSAPLPDSPKRSTHRPATSAFAASSGT